MGTLVGIAVGTTNVKWGKNEESWPKDAIKFADPVVGKICAESWGDGTYITKKQAALVTSLGAKFKGNTEITSFNELKEFGVKSLDANAFNGCTSLASVNLPPSLSKIGQDAFKLCTSLVNITLPSSITNIDGYALYRCPALAIVIDLPNLETLGTNAFGMYGNETGSLIGIENLGKITTIPNSGRSDLGCFRNQKSLTYAKLPDTLTSIGNHAFYGCSALASVNFPSSLTSIGSAAFYGCSSMAITSLELPQCTSIGSYAFNEAKLPSEITFQNVTTVGACAFKASTISKITLPSVETMSAVSNYDGIFSYCTNLVLVDLGENCSSIGNESFGRFVGTSGKNITLICRASTPPTLEGPIINKGWIKATISEIYVPDASVEAYKTATNWSAYANIILPLSQYKG